MMDPNSHEIVDYQALSPQEQRARDKRIRFTALALVAFIVVSGLIFFFKVQDNPSFFLKKETIENSPTRGISSDKTPETAFVLPIHFEDWV